jgi:hypothetical protein
MNHSLNIIKEEIYSVLFLRLLHTLNLKLVGVHESV